MRSLYLLRHAKSSWDEPDGRADLDRPLARRGQRDAETLALRFARGDAPIDLVLCSPAVRARATLEPTLGVLGPDVAVWTEPSIYGGGVADMLAAVRSVPDEARGVLVVGHLPGIRDLALTLAGEGNADALARLTAKFPTAALAIMAVGGEWGELAAGQAELTDFITIKDDR